MQHPVRLAERIERSTTASVLKVPATAQLSGLAGRDTGTRPGFQERSSRQDERAFGSQRKSFQLCLPRGVEAPTATAARGALAGRLLARRRRSPAGGPHLPDRRSAARARLALAAVHQELVLERATGPVDVPEVVDRGAAGVDAELERLHHGVAELGQLRRPQPVDRPERVDPGAEERLVGVDVAHARDPLLVQQERLDRRLPPARQLAHRLRREVGPSGSTPTPREVVLERLVTQQHDSGPEAPRVGEQHAPAVLQEGPHPDVLAVRAVVGLRDQQQVPRHPQMHDQVDLVLEPQSQVLAAALERLDATPVDRRRQLGRARASTSSASMTSRRSSRCPPRGAPAGRGRSLPREARALPELTHECARSAGGARVRLEVHVLEPLAREVRVQLRGRATSAWPSISWTERRSQPPASRWVAKVWRSVCGLIRSSRPALRACFWMIL